MPGRVPMALPGRLRATEKFRLRQHLTFINAFEGQHESSANREVAVS
jgi:hypothetical protein